MTHIHNQSDIESIMIAWSDLGINLLYRATGVEWGSIYEVSLLDAVIKFNQGEYKLMTNCYCFTESIETNFLSFLLDIIFIARLWKKAHE